MTDIFLQVAKIETGLDFIPEYRFHKIRKWRFDYANLEYKIAIEVEGGIFKNGRHVRGIGFIKDMEKYNNATVLGWKVLRTSPKELCSKSFIGLIKQIIDTNIFC